MAIVLAWHDALNAGDAERLLALSSSHIEVSGPRGSGEGGAVLRAWLGRAGLQLHPRQLFQRDHTVVVEAEALWKIDGGDDDTEPTVLASVFVVHEGRITSISRHRDLASALDSCGLTGTERVTSHVPRT